MKKAAAVMIAAVLVLTAGAVNAFSAEYHRGQRYIDLNNDGICDNQAAGYGGRCFIDNDGDGVCDYYGTRCYNDCAEGYYCQGTGCASGCFIDNDGDGICDYYGTGLGMAYGRNSQNGQNGQNSQNGCNGQNMYSHHGRGNCHNR